MIDQKTKELLDNLTPEDITKTFISDLFGRTSDGNYIKPTEGYKVPINKFDNDKPIDTTVGRYIYNLFILQKKFVKLIGYINKPLTKSSLSDIENLLAEKTLNNEITIPEIRDYMDRLQWFSYLFSSILCSSSCVELAIMDPRIKKRKEELLKKYKKEIDNNDVVTSLKIEKELVDYAKEIFKDLPSVDLFNSKASKTSFENSYKTMNIMKGPVKAPSGKGYVIAKSNLVEGIPIEEYPLYANEVVESAYSKSIEPRDSGYKTKQMFSAFQSIVLDKPGSDCHTTKTIKVKITEDNYKLYQFRYAVARNGYVELTLDILKKNIGNVLNIRSPLYCTTNKICNICAGNSFNKLQISSIGLTTNKLMSTLLNAGFKAMHNTTVSSVKINPFDYIKFNN